MNGETMEDNEIPAWSRMSSVKYVDSEANKTNLVNWRVKWLPTKILSATLISLKNLLNTDYLIVHRMESFRLFRWIETYIIFRARSSRDSAVCLVSSFTMSWWLPSSSCISVSTNADQNTMRKTQSTYVPSKTTWARGGNADSRNGCLNFISSCASATVRFWSSSMSRS